MGINVTGLSFDSYNRDCTVPVILDEKDFAEIMGLVHYRVATSNNTRISWCRGEVYPASRKAFEQAIRAAYPKADIEDVYEIWSDCHESVAYCVNVSKCRKQNDAEDSYWNNIIYTEDHEEALALNSDMRDKSDDSCDTLKLGKFRVGQVTDNLPKTPNPHVVREVLTLVKNL